MSLRFPAILHSLQPGFKTSSSAQLLARKPSRRSQLFASCPRCGFSNNAQGLARKKIGILQKPKQTGPICRGRKPAAYEPITEQLALRTCPTLLYQASPKIDHLFGCYAVGSGLFAAAWFNFQTQFYVKSGGVPPWVPAFTSVGSFMIACASFWMFLKVRSTTSLGFCSKIDAVVSQKIWFGPSAVFPLQQNQDKGLGLGLYFCR